MFMRNYDSIQDLRNLSDDIFNCVDDYLKYYCTTSDDVVASKENMGLLVDENLSVDILSCDEVGDSSGYYPLKSLLRLNDAGAWEPDIDAAEDIAANYVFVR